jgi:ribosomal protein S18 acetylase RimI-like enzyme
MILIRRADISDSAIIASLGRITFTETFGDLFPKRGLEDYLIKTFSVENISFSLGKKNNIYWLAFEDGNPVGYAKIKLDSEAEEIGNDEQIQLQKIYVLKEYLDKNIGSALMKEILSYEKINTGSVLWLVVLYSNERAIKFYDRFGFKKFKKHYQQIGAINFKYEIMVKAI